MRHKIKCITTLLVAALSIPMIGCQQQVKFAFEDDSGNTCSNIAMAMGRFASRGDFLYFSEPGGIYEYDLESGKTVFIEVESPDDPQDLIVTENHIGYSYFDYMSNYPETTCGIKIVTKDGKDRRIAVKWDGSCGNLYMEGTKAFYLSDEKLWSRDLSKEDTAPALIIDHAFKYFVSEERLYAILKAEDAYTLHQSSRDQIAFEQIPLSFSPIVVLAHEDDLYLSKMGTYDVVRWSNGAETELPICSLKYQVLDDCLIYSDETTFDGNWTIKQYNLKNGEEKILCENVLEFGILQERYICFWCRDNNYSSWKLYDWETGETKDIDITQ